MDIQNLLKRHAQLVLTIQTTGALTGADVRAAQELSAALKDMGASAPDYVGCIAGANIERLGDGYVLSMAKELLSETIQGV